MTMKRSALFHLHKSQNAVFTDHQGWLVPGYFSAPEQEMLAVQTKAGLADVSYLSKFDLQDEPPHSGLRLGSNHYLMMGEPPVHPPTGAIDVSSVYACFCLAGPRGRDVLNKLTSLNVSDAALPNRSCGQTSVAHTHALIMRDDIGSILAFRILVSREFGESVWESIMHAGHEFHLCSFGIKTLMALHN
jgi:glycine cleavage system aminomethyltransferase T